MTDIAAIPKDRKNDKQSYKYRGIDEVYNELHTLFAKHGVYMVPEVLTSDRQKIAYKSGTEGVSVVLRVKYTFYSTGDGSSVSCTVVGEGMDSGDKATNKAMSAAHKYALLQTFIIPTDEPKDSEVDNHEVARSSQPPIHEPQEMFAATTSVPTQSKVSKGQWLALLEAAKQTPYWTQAKVQALMEKKFSTKRGGELVQEQYAQMLKAIWNSNPIDEEV